MRIVHRRPGVDGIRDSVAVEKDGEGLTARFVLYLAALRPAVVSVEPGRIILRSGDSLFIVVEGSKEEILPLIAVVDWYSSANPKASSRTVVTDLILNNENHDSKIISFQLN